MIYSSKPIKPEGATQRRERLAAIIWIENETYTVHDCMYILKTNKANNDYYNYVKKKVYEHIHIRIQGNCYNYIVVVLFSDTYTRRMCLNPQYVFWHFNFLC